MSLDIVILDDEGGPSHEIAVPQESHSQLMLQAEALALHQLSRMHDYYQDVDYTTYETLLLQRETDKLAAQCSGKPEFCALVDQIQSLVRHAVNDNKAIVAIAD